MPGISSLPSRTPSTVPTSAILTFSDAGSQYEARCELPSRLRIHFRKGRDSGPEASERTAAQLGRTNSPPGAVGHARRPSHGLRSALRTRGGDPVCSGLCRLRCRGLATGLPCGRGPAAEASSITPSWLSCRASAWSGTFRGSACLPLLRRCFRSSAFHAASLSRLLLFSRLVAHGTQKIDRLLTDPSLEFRCAGFSSSSRSWRRGPLRVGCCHRSQRGWRPARRHPRTRHGAPTRAFRIKIPNSMWLSRASLRS